MSLGENSLVAAYQGKRQLKSLPSGTRVVTISIICLAVVLVLVLKDSLRTYFKSLSLSWSLGVRSLLTSLHRGTNSKIKLTEFARIPRPSPYIRLLGRSATPPVATLLLRDTIICSRPTLSVTQLQLEAFLFKKIAIYNLYISIASTKIVFGRFVLKLFACNICVQLFYIYEENLDKIMNLAGTRDCARAVSAFEVTGPRHKKV